MGSLKEDGDVGPVHRVRLSPFVRNLSPRWGLGHHAWGTRADARVYPLARLRRWGRIAMAMTRTGGITRGSTNVEAVGWVPSPGVGSWNAAWGHAAFKSGMAAGRWFLPDEFEQGDFP